MRMCSVVTLIVASSGAALAGPLNPPPGPIADTGRFGPRIEINQQNTPGDADSLFRIEKPGSYYVSGDIGGEPAQSGIEIATGGVTIDLSGFTLRGDSGTLNGIVSEPGLRNIRIHSGFVEEWDRGGIDLSASTGNTLVTGIVSSGNGGVGIATPGNSLVSGCAADSNAEEGIICGSNSVIAESVASSNALDGITVGSAGLITSCTAFENQMDGFFVSSGSTITASSAQSNLGNNITARFGCTVSNCTSRNAGQIGISARNASVVIGCSVQNPSVQGTIGIEIGQAAIVSNCVVQNFATAIQADIATRVTGCIISFYTTGVQVASRCVISRCSTTNGTVGFDLIGADASVTACEAIANAAEGFLVSGAGGNLLIGNSAAGNGTNYSTTGLDTVGPIVNSATIGVSSNPHANYEY